MLILGIESTCDETACALVEDGKTIIEDTISSQINEHVKTKGVVPEVAARRHALDIIDVLKKTFHTRKLQDIDAIAVSYGPGLLGCILTGTVTAQMLALVLDKPLIPVNHIEGHLYSGWLERKKDYEFPIIVLTASGGHNQLILMKDHGDYTVLGETLDDAAGEAFDKGAKMLGLPYPGGPSIQQCAQFGNEQNGHKAGDELAFNFPIALSKNIHAKSYNFSFSGLKTALRTAIIHLKQNDNFEKHIPDLCASYQKAICNTLISKLRLAVQNFTPKAVHIAGGVSANSALRASLLIEDFSYLVHFPNLKYCTDNAAMIACTGYFNYVKNPGKYKTKNIIPDPNLRISNLH